MAKKLRITLIAFIISVFCRSSLAALVIDTSVSLAVMETEASQISLGCLTCVDNAPPSPPRDISMDKVSINPSIFCGNCFDIFRGSDRGLATPDWCVFYLPSQGTLNYTLARRYIMTVECYDGVVRETSDITIKVDPNEPPEKTSDPPVCTDIPASTIAGAGVYSGVLGAVTDPNPTDTHTCTMTTVPESDNFVMNSDTCSIVAKNDLSRECNPSITFQISVSDGHNQPIGPISVTCPMSGFSARPVITNLNKSAIIPEDRAVGEVGYTFDIPDGPGIVTYTITGVDNPTARSIFRIDGDNLVVNQKLDYEDEFGLNNFRVYIQADNGNCDPVLHYLDVEVGEVNEPPILTVLNSRINVNEYNSLTRVNSYANPQFTCDLQKEEDEECTYSIVSGNDEGHFSINPETGEITSDTIDIDPNTEDVLHTLEIQVEDSRGLTDTATVRLVVQDVNDNKPVIAQADAGLTYTVTDCTEPSILPVRLDASDEDSVRESNNIVTFVQTGSSSDCIDILPDGTVQLLRSVLVTETCRAQARAVDRGGNAAGSLTSDVTAEVVITSIPCPTEPPVEPDPDPVPDPDPDTSVNTGGDTGTDGDTDSAASSSTALGANTAGADFGVIFGILGGILGAILLASLLAWCCRRKCCAKRKTSPFSSEETASKKKKTMSKLKKKKKANAAAATAAAAAPVAAAAAAPMLLRIRRKIPFMKRRVRVPIRTVSRFVPMTSQPPPNTTIPLRSSSGVRTVIPAPPPYRMVNSAPVYGSYA